LTKKATIYGKPTCPFTRRARETYAAKGYEVDFVDVQADPSRLEDMLRLSGGRRRIPVILDGDEVTIGLRGS